jgi:hypothetical protein
VTQRSRSNQSALRLAWATADAEALEQQDADEVAQVRSAGGNRISAASVTMTQPLSRAGPVTFASHASVVSLI